MLQAKRISRILDQIKSSERRNSPLELIVGFEPDKRQKTIKSLKRLGKVVHSFEALPYTVLRCDYKTGKGIAGFFFKQDYAAEFRAVFRQLDYINSVEVAGKVAKIPTRAGKAAAVKNKASGLWNLEDVGAYEAQALGTGTGSRIGVIDTGVDYGHQEIRENFEGTKGYDFVTDSKDPMDRNGHGTHVAGIIAGKTTGVAPTSTIYGLRVLDEDGKGSETNTMRAIEWAVTNDLDIVNMSLGGPQASEAFRRMCEFAYGQGLLLVAAAGNTGFGPSYPAAFGESVIAVPAVDRENKHPYFSNICETNDISAPGVDIMSAYLEGSYKELSGTSMAAPHVTGTLALMVPFERDQETLELALMETALPLDASPWKSGDTFGAGLIKADKALGMVYRRDLKNILSAGGQKLFNVVKTIVW